METSKSLEKLFMLSFYKQLNRTNLNKQTLTGSHITSSSLLGVNSCPSPHEFLTRNISIKHCNCKRNHIFMANYPESVLSANVNPDIFLLRTPNRPSLLLKKMLWRVNGVKSNKFFTLTNNKFFNKLRPFDDQYQVPSKLFSYKADIEQTVPGEVGWAGQPIMKRVHTLLPEVCSDMLNTIQPVKESTITTKGYKDHELSTLTPSESNACDALENTYEKCQNNLICTDNTTATEQVESFMRSHDTIHLINKSIAANLTNEVQTTENVNEKIVSAAGSKYTNIISSTGNKMKVTKAGHRKALSKPGGVVLKCSKKKMRKKTKVRTTITGNQKHGNKNKKGKKIFRVSKGNKLHNQFVLNQSTYVQPFQKTLMENREMKTDSAIRYSRTPAAKQRTSKLKNAIKSKGNNSNKINSSRIYEKEIFADDCVCPESSEIKQHKSTKICGEVALVKRLTQWKPKMCLVQKKVNTRRRTFVCAYKVSKERRKRNLPKCIKPEKKTPPRVLICPLNLKNESTAKTKRCQKQEEVKIRKRTQVCKPIVFFGKQRNEVKEEKIICEKKVKKVKSRHTKVCSSDDKTTKKTSKR